MRKIVPLTIIIAIVSIYLQIPSLASETFNYKTGLLPDTYNEIVEHLETTATYTTLPTSVDNTSSFPAPGNQGQQNSCVGWAVGYALKSGSECKKRGWTASSNNHKFSPAYIYNQINNGTDDGAHILDALELIKTQGVCTLPYFAYSQNNYTKQPTAIQTANANLYKVSEYHSLIGIRNIKEKISKNYGVVIGIEIYPDFTNLSPSNSIYDTISGSKQGEHAICLIGYDDSKGDNGAFKFINSWGTDWGVGGYGWISYDTVVAATPVLNLAVGYYIETSADTYTMGDVDGNDIIDISDARLVLNYANNATTLTPSQYVLADVDGYGTVTEADSREILRMAAGQLTKFSLYE